MTTFPNSKIVPSYAEWRLTATSKFKAVPQLATPPESPAKGPNRAANNDVNGLTLFANKLLKLSDVDYRGKLHVWLTYEQC